MVVRFGCRCPCRRPQSTNPSTFCQQGRMVSRVEGRQTTLLRSLSVSQRFPALHSAGAGRPDHGVRGLGGDVVQVAEEDDVFRPSLPRKRFARAPQCLRMLVANPGGDMEHPLWYSVFRSNRDSCLRCRRGS